MTGEDLTPEEMHMVQAAVRAAIKHADKGRAGLLAKHGGHADLTGSDARIGLLESAYRKLGKDPTLIDHRGR